MPASFGVTVVRGVFSGWLIALMVWLLPSARSGRLLTILLVTYTVAVSKLSHVIAGSVEAAYAVMIGAASVSRLLPRVPRADVHRQCDRRRVARRDRQSCGDRAGNQGRAAERRRLNARRALLVVARARAVQAVVEAAAAFGLVILARGRGARLAAASFDCGFCDSCSGEPRRIVARGRIGLRFSC